MIASLLIAAACIVTDAELAEAIALSYLEPTPPAAATAETPKPATKAAGDSKTWDKSRRMWRHADGSLSLQNYPTRSVSGKKWHHNGSYEISPEHLASAHGLDLVWLKTLPSEQRQALHADCHEGQLRTRYAVMAVKSKPKSSGYWATVKVCTGRSCRFERRWVPN